MISSLNHQTSQEVSVEATTEGTAPAKTAAPQPQALPKQNPHRQKKLALALRQNLLKRKNQMRQRQEEAEDASSLMASTLMERA